jgi:hypothetical protein
MYTNIPSEKTASSSDQTLKVFDGVNSKSVELNNSALTAMVGFLESRNFKNPSAEFIAITILKQAKADGYDAWEIIRTLKGTDDATLSGTVAEILNYNRFKTSTLGIVQTVSPVEDIKRNILA